MPTLYPKFVKPSIAAKLYDVSTATLRKWAKTGKIGFVRTPCNHYRYDVSAFGGTDAVVPAVETKPQRKKAAKTSVAAPIAAPIPDQAPAVVQQLHAGPVDQNAIDLAELQGLLAHLTARGVDLHALIPSRPSVAAPAPAVVPTISKADLASRLDALCGFHA